MKLAILTAATLAALAASATSGARATVPTLTIRHEAVGCHSWSLNGGSYGAEQSVRLLQGQSLRVVNHDSSVHRLVQLSGGALAISSGPWLPLRMAAGAAIPLPPDPGDALPQAVDGVMAQRGSVAVATFYEPGTYVLGTVEGGAFAGLDDASTGPDHALTIRVRVLPHHHYPPL